VTRHRRRLGVRGRLVVAAAGVLVLVAATLAVVTFLRGERCTAVSVTLTVVAAPSSAPVLEQLAQSWNGDGRTVDGQCTAVAVRSMESHVVSAALGASWDEQRDGPRPDVWNPDSSTWLLVAAGRPDAAAVLPSLPPQSVATSPVVLAMQKPMAEALGWPGRPIGWTDLVGGFANGGTWGRFGHPEWGTLRLGAADPTHSIAGLAGILSTLDIDNDNTLSDQELFSGVAFAQLVSDYTPDTESLVRKFTESGAAEPTTALPAAFPVLERDLAVYAARQPSVTLVPVYPREGTAIADYPFAVLHASWVDATRQRLAAAFLDYLGESAGQRAFAAAGFRNVNHAANSTLLTADRGFQASITQVRRAPTAEGLGQLLGAWTLLQRPTNLLVALDTSGSMNQAVPNTTSTRLQLLQRAAIQGIALLTNHTVVNLWQFSSRLTPTADYRELVPVGPAGENIGQVTRRQAMIGAIQQLTAAGGTGLYDTIDAAYQQMRRTWQPNAQNVMVVITDGKNEDAAGLSLPQLLQRLRQAVRPDQPLQFVGIAVGPQADADALNRVADVTGGRVFVARDETTAIQQIVLAFAGRIAV
jgi:Ca-activated chloride channel homolog